LKWGREREREREVHRAVSGFFVFLFGFFE
jgi:hypothetical protein